MRHLTQVEMREYRNRKLSPAAMLAADDHVTACEECRKMLRECEPLVDSAALLAQLGEPHLTYEETETYVEERAGQDEQRRIASHLDLCQSCSDEVADLRRFRRQVAAEFVGRKARQDGRRKSLAQRARRIPGWSAAAAVVAIAVGAGWWWTSAPRTPDLVASALNTGDLHIPDTVLALRGTRAVLRGPRTGPNFALIDPVATAVLGQTPRFTWQPLTGAGAYRVAVFASGFDKVAQSPWLESTEWTPSAPLARSQTYAWQVTARMGTTEDAPTVLAPTLTDPEARFLVLDAAQATALDHAAREHAGAHLLLGILYARAGVLDVAEQELAAHADDHPQDVQVGALLEKIRTVRR
jgi:hypothetical protein